jgi:hypothetical protein
MMMRRVLGFALGTSLLFFSGLGAAWAQGGEAGAPPPPIDESSITHIVFVGGGVLNPGTLGLCEVPLVNATCAQLSDTLTFLNTTSAAAPGQNIGEVQFNSDLDAGEVPPTADTGTLATSIDKLVQEPPAGANGAETLSYIPGASDPGAQFDCTTLPAGVACTTATGTFVSVDYMITSDSAAVPEPSTLALLLTGMCPCAVAYARRRARQSLTER